MLLNTKLVIATAMKANKMIFWQTSEKNSRSKTTFRSRKRHYLAKTSSRSQPAKKRASSNHSRTKTSKTTTFTSQKVGKMINKDGMVCGTRQPLSNCWSAEKVFQSCPHTTILRAKVKHHPSKKGSDSRITSKRYSESKTKTTGFSI